MWINNKGIDIRSQKIQTIKLRKWTLVFAGVFFFSILSSASAMAQICGDSVVEVPELCDDGNMIDNDGCSSICQTETGYDCPVCGNGSLDSPEQCDDGNLINGDGCNDGCQIERDLSAFTVETYDVGDSVVPGIWELNANNTEVTISTAANPEPGVFISPDDVFDSRSVLEFGFALKSSADNDFIGIVLGYQPGDFLNPNADFLLLQWKGAAQTTNSADPFMCPGGNGEGLKLLRVQGVVEADELWAPEIPCGSPGSVTVLATASNYATTGFLAVADPSMRVVYTAGRIQVYVKGILEIDFTDAALPTAGKYGFYTYAQQGNVLAALSGTAGCASICGDGLIVGGEECDDGNNIDGDGCNSVCNIEARYTCNLAPSVCTPDCGDGFIDGSESCDDANLIAGDGCSSTCTVEDGYECNNAPSMCVDVDECVENTDNCDAIAVCTNTIGSFLCACPTGYTDPNSDGTQCIDIDECVIGTDICDALVICTNIAGAYTCGACPSGYTDPNGDGSSCVEIDECAEGTHNCDSLSTCTNTVGSFNCSGCPDGYDDVDGNGTNCEDIDECILGTDQCDILTICTNTDGAFTCSACPPGYIDTAGNGTQCVDIDECTEGTDECDSAVLCTNIAGSYTCAACPSGYTDSNGDGSLCVDIDECEAADSCDAVVTCENTPGSFTCSACPDGYLDSNGDASQCIDINECDLATDDCSEYATCTNTVSSFSCTCDEGYEGSGQVCQEVASADVLIQGGVSCSSNGNSNPANWLWIFALAFLVRRPKSRRQI